MLRLVVYLIVICLTFGIGHYSGKNNVRVCPEQNAKLITSSHSNNGTICVYQEPWKTKGKIKRVGL